ncbi:hypothetical protein ABEP66_08800 [Cutibacterium acnes]
MIDRHVVIAGGHGRPGLCCRLEFLGAEFGCLAGVLGIDDHVGGSPYA